jgi:AAA15 family ATPase/GTPase
LRYKDGHFYGGKSADFLLPPFGDNLFGVIDRSRELRMEVAELFKELGLDFVLSRKDGKFELQKNVDGIVYKYPYTGIADTFKRFIFYLAAIDSNKDSVLILEEPEVHAFPPYTKQLADRIALREENQFFLSTHSPYLLNTLIEVLGDEALAVTLVYFENYETKIHTLTPSELREVQDFSIDIFFNLDKFIGDGAPAA